MSVWSSSGSGAEREREQNAKEPREDANVGDLEDDRVQTNAERMELNYVQNPEYVRGAKTLLRGASQVRRR